MRIWHKEQLGSKSDIDMINMNYEHETRPDMTYPPLNEQLPVPKQNTKFIAHKAEVRWA